MNEAKRHPKIIDGEELMHMTFPQQNYIIENLMSQGLHILGGAPKVGKSWLALWLAMMVADGATVWGNRVKQGTTLYLCLEDNENRLQSRALDLTEEIPKPAHFMMEPQMIGNGLEDTFEKFIEEHLDTVLIIIDTLQKVRNPGADNSYANDYRELSVLKSFADKHAIGILLIHHLRKEKDSDVFNMLSGTTAIQGVADGVFTLVESYRGSGRANLSCTGRDIEYRELELKRDEDNVWQMVSDSRVTGEQINSFIFLLSEFKKHELSFLGTPTELAEKLSAYGEKKVTPKMISKNLICNAAELKELGITFDVRRSNGKRIVEITVNSADSAVSDEQISCDTPPTEIDPCDPAKPETEQSLACPAHSPCAAS